jgi:hypothetical protein
MCDLRRPDRQLRLVVPPLHPATAWEVKVDRRLVLAATMRPSVGKQRTCNASTSLRRTSWGRSPTSRRLTMWCWRSSWPGSTAARSASSGGCHWCRARPGHRRAPRRRPRLRQDGSVARDPVVLRSGRRAGLFTSLGTGPSVGAVARHPMPGLPRLSCHRPVQRCSTGLRRRCMDPGPPTWSSSASAIDLYGK